MFGFKRGMKSKLEGKVVFIQDYQWGRAVVVTENNSGFFRIDTIVEAQNDFLGIILEFYGRKWSSKDKCFSPLQRGRFLLPRDYFKTANIYKYHEFLELMKG